jgi:hypothetical protein
MANYIKYPLRRKYVLINRLYIDLQIDEYYYILNTFMH